MLLEQAIPWVLGLLGTAVVLQAIGVTLLWRVGNALKTERPARARAVEPAGVEAAARKPEGAEGNRLFARFLEEDPSRAELPKREQFAAFRRWRQENGYNWGA